MWGYSADKPVGILETTSHASSHTPGKRAEPRIMSHKYCTGEIALSVPDSQGPCLREFPDIRSKTTNTSHSSPCNNKLNNTNWYQYKDISGIFSTHFKIPTTYKCKMGTCKAACMATGKSEVNPDLCWFQCSIPVPKKAETSRPPVSNEKKGTSVENKVLVYNHIKRHYLATFIQWKNSKNLIKIMDVHPKELVCQYVYEEIFDKILGVLQRP